MGLTLQSRPRLKSSFQARSQIFLTKKLGNRTKWKTLKRKPATIYAGIENLSKKGRHIQYSKAFQRRWRDSKALNSFYGNLREDTLKKIIIKSVRNQNSQQTKSENFIISLERRLDVSLFRSGLCRSIFEARQLISHGKVLVDNQKSKYGSQSLQLGSLVIVNNGNKLDLESTFRLQGAIICPKYLTVSYSTMSFVFSYMPDVCEITFPFEVNPEALFEFYRI
jgi:small subunit ribosomal protein S4